MQRKSPDTMFDWEQEPDWVPGEDLSPLEESNLRLATAREAAIAAGLEAPRVAAPVLSARPGMRRTGGQKTQAMLLDLRPRPWKSEPRVSSRPPVLIINSYAGSLVLGAKSLGMDVVGSYEDGAYGLDVQTMNFPGLSYAGSRKHWPNDSLDGAGVFAHPPCAAFSVQNTGSGPGQSADGTGVNAKKFQETIEVLEYGMERKANFVLIESVVPAMLGAREVHEMLARKHGYHLYRILQNSATFGLAQWRARFWAAFVRPDLLPASGSVWVAHEPSWLTVGQLQEQGLGGEPIPRTARYWDRQLAKVRSKGVDEETLAKMVAGGYRYGHWWKVCAAAFGLSTRSSEERTAVSREWCDTVFESSQFRVLDPDEQCPTLVHDSRWIVNSRLLTDREYKAVMGYPVDYQFPGTSSGNMSAGDFRGFLSRGVCPPVAAWVLDTVSNWIEGVEPPLSGVTWLSPGGLADLRPVKANGKR